ncbi:hypothetical protein [Sporichthya sp.]|uniref:hypothetical protein n=1 Tax=Sporichthya sp. TaxID=65475 RepID=UPI0017C1C2A1|nr:hypothetical protein [Sporichthya sp.]MBA3741566.1 hypothetical protein [Sporichthya sp.]
MDDGPLPPGPATAPPRLGRPGDPLPARSGRQVVVVLGTMVIFFFALVMVATWAAKNG